MLSNFRYPVINAPSTILDASKKTGTNIKLPVEPNAPFATPQEVGEAFGMGASASVALGAPFDVVEVRNTARAIEQKYNVKPVVSNDSYKTEAEKIRPVAEATQRKMTSDLNNAY